MRFCFSILCFSFFVLLTIFTFGLQAQEITRGAVLDYGAVLKEFSRQSWELQRITELKTEVEEEMGRLKEQLLQLQEELRKAEDENENSKARRLQNEIKKLRDYGFKYVESKNEEITAQQEEIALFNRSKDMQKIIPDIISQLAREQGYSIIIEKNSQNIIWFDASIDITEAVIQRLEKRLNE